MTYNSEEYGWKDLTVEMGGRIITGIRGIKYSTKQEKEVIYAKGNSPHSIQRGNKSHEGSIKLLQSELEALTEAATGGDILNLTVTINVSYGNPGNGDAIKNDSVRGVQFTESTKEMNQGDKFMEIELPFIALDIKRNVQ